MLFTASKRENQVYQKKIIISQNSRLSVGVCHRHSCCMAFWGSLFPNETVFAAIERAQKGLLKSDNYHTHPCYFSTCLIPILFKRPTFINSTLHLVFYINHKVKMIF